MLSILSDDLVTAGAKMFFVSIYPFLGCPCLVGTLWKNGTCCNDDNQCAECPPGPWMKNNGSSSLPAPDPTFPSSEGK